MCATLREPSRGRSEGDVTSLRPIGYNETIMASSFNLNAYGAMFRVKAAYSFEVGGLLVRMYAFMRTIGTVSMLTLSGYSYFMAGLVASVVAFALFNMSRTLSRGNEGPSQENLSRLGPFYHHPMISSDRLCHQTDARIRSLIFAG